MNILFISETTLKENSLIADHADMKLISPVISMVQDVRICPLLGTGLFRALQESIAGGSVPGHYKVLLEGYIHPCLSWHVVAELVETYGDGFTRGLLQTDAYASTHEKLSSRLRNYAEYYGQRLVSFLEAHHQKYLAQFLPADAMRPQRTGYQTGLNIDV